MGRYGRHIFFSRGAGVSKMGLNRRRLVGEVAKALAALGNGEPFLAAAGNCALPVAAGVNKNS
jgi:hypothetical protein